MAPSLSFFATHNCSKLPLSRCMVHQRICNTSCKFCGVGQVLFPRHMARQNATSPPAIERPHALARDGPDPSPSESHLGAADSDPPNLHLHALTSPHVRPRRADRRGGTQRDTALLHTRGSPPELSFTYMDRRARRPSQLLPALSPTRDLAGSPPGDWRRRHAVAAHMHLLSPIPSRLQSRAS